MVLDFEKAFMTIPLVLPEQAYNACEIDQTLERGRPPAYPGEPEDGHVVVWKVLGFGGKANPLVYSRCAGFAARVAQGLLRTTRTGAGHPQAAIGRAQMYVDDPALTSLGTPEEVDAAFDLVVLLWRLLGIPLALSKGITEEGPPISGYGAVFTLRENPQGAEAIIGAPPAFAE